MIFDGWEDWSEDQWKEFAEELANADNFDPGEVTNTMELHLDEYDYAAIQRAMARRQQYRVMPEGSGNLAGRLLAEICRCYSEYMESLDRMNEQ